MALQRLTATSDSLEPSRFDTQTTSFSIDAIARFACNTWEEVQGAKGPRGFDIAIVGSGMYGTYVAAKLFEFGEELGNAAPRVVVLESGPFLVSEHVQNLPRTGNLGELVEEPLVGPPTQRELTEPPHRVRPEPDLLAKHHRCVGGKSLFWGGWSPTLLEDDLRRPDSPWPKEVVDYLFQPGALEEPDDGYPFIGREIGAKEDTDFLQGYLYRKLLDRAEEAFAGVRLGESNETRLDAVERPPIAVQGQPPASGLFSLDKYSSLLLLLDAIRRDIDAATENHRVDNQKRRLFLIPNAQALRLEGYPGRGFVTGVRVALLDRLASGVVREENSPQVTRSVETLGLNPGGSVILAAHTIESTRLALNLFPRPSALGADLMGRNLMCHLRSNHVWQVKRDALGLPVGPLGNAALHVRGRSRKLDDPDRRGQFHFQVYASANVPSGDGLIGPLNAEEYLYRVLPNFDELQEIRDAQDEEVLAIGIRTCGEMFGDRTSGDPTTGPTSWVNTSAPGVADEPMLQEPSSSVFRGHSSDS